MSCDCLVTGDHNMRKLLGQPLPSTLFAICGLCFVLLFLLQSADVSVMPWLQRDIIDKVSGEL